MLEENSSDDPHQEGAEMTEIEELAKKLFEISGLVAVLTIEDGPAGLLPCLNVKTQYKTKVLETLESIIEQEKQRKLK